jgi:hypothetical protein
MSHTPGPWRWFDYPDGRKLLSATTRAVIHCPDAPMTCDPEDQQVIAAVPELYAALKALVLIVVEHNPTEIPAQWHDAVAALAKAEGR